MYNSTRVSVKVVQVIVVKFLVTKNQSRCLNVQNNSTHVQHTCMHTFLLLFFGWNDYILGNADEA